MTGTDERCPRLAGGTTVVDLSRRHEEGANIAVQLRQQVAAYHGGDGWGCRRTWRWPRCS
jgi:hypothetical protein